MINWKSKYLKYKSKYLKIKGGMYREQESLSPSSSSSSSLSRSSSSTQVQSNSTVPNQTVLYGNIDLNNQGISQQGHLHDCVAGSLMCGNFIFKDSYFEYLERSKGRGLQDHQIEELIRKRYPSAKLTDFEHIKNISNAFALMPNDVIVPIVIRHQTGTKHMVLIGKTNGTIFLRDQQDNHLTKNNTNIQDRSLFIGEQNIEKYLQGYDSFRVVLHEGIEDISHLVKNLEF
jgi:hypothetical protein